MIKCGLVSISFRSLSCEEIIKITKESGLEGIEWGGDVHVPSGDKKQAKYVAELMKKSELQTSAYGSYYKIGTYGKNFKDEFKKVLEAAVALGAPVIRIWAGTQASAKTSDCTRKALTDECIEIADMAAKENVTLAFECHRNTLTDDYKSSLKLMKETDRKNLKMFWQPNEEKSYEYNLKALKELLPYIVNAHVFNWPNPGIRKPISEADDQWKNYFSVLNNDEKSHWCSLEFMPDDKPESLFTEAETIKNLAKNAAQI